MQVGQPLRTTLVEPLESRAPTTVPTPQPDPYEPEPEPLARTRARSRHTMTAPDYISLVVGYRVWQWDATGLASLNGFKWRPGEASTRRGASTFLSATLNVGSMMCRCGRGKRGSLLSFLCLCPSRAASLQSPKFSYGRFDVIRN